MRAIHPHYPSLRRAASLVLSTLLVGSTVLAAGCTNYMQLTRKMVVENKFTDDELKRIQYFNSDDIYFERTVTGDAELTEGKLVARGRVVDQVLVECRTPGIVERIEEVEPELGDRGIKLWVSFERGTVIPFIGYGDGIFAIYAPEGTVQLGKITYDVKNDLQNEERPHLLIQGDALEAIKNRRRMPGRVLGE